MGDKRISHQEAREAMTAGMEEIGCDDAQFAAFRRLRAYIAQQESREEEVGCDDSHSTRRLMALDAFRQLAAAIPAEVARSFRQELDAMERHLKSPATEDAVVRLRQQLHAAHQELAAYRIALDALTVRDAIPADDREWWEYGITDAGGSVPLGRLRTRAKAVSHVQQVWFNLTGAGRPNRGAAWVRHVRVAILGDIEDVTPGRDGDGTIH